MCCLRNSDGNSDVRLDPVAEFLGEWSRLKKLFSISVFENDGRPLRLIVPPTFTLLNIDFRGRQVEGAPVPESLFPAFDV
jgi:hypothetical protein